MRPASSDGDIQAGRNENKRYESEGSTCADRQQQPDAPFSDEFESNGEFDEPFSNDLEAPLLLSNDQSSDSDDPV